VIDTMRRLAEALARHQNGRDALWAILSDVDDQRYRAEAVAAESTAEAEEARAVARMLAIVLGDAALLPGGDVPPRPPDRSGSAPSADSGGGVPLRPPPGI
jgi:hypothetical protein